MAIHYIRRISLTAFFIVWMCALQLAFSPVGARAEGVVGKYLVKGWDPGVEQIEENAYIGTLEITRRGDEFFLEAEIDGSRYMGVGLQDESSGSISFSFVDHDGEVVGLSVAKAGENGYDVRWTIGSGSVGREIWTRE